MSDVETTGEVPNFITPTDISKWSDKEIDVLLDGIRYRRMQAHVIYSETQKTREIAAKVKLEGLIDKKLEKLRKAIDKVDVVLEKLELAVNEVRALRVQLGEDEL